MAFPLHSDPLPGFLPGISNPLESEARMSQDRYLKVVSTVIAVALSVIAMALIDSDPTASAIALPEVVEGTLGEPAEGSSGLVPAAATSTLPPRWRIPYARHIDNSAGGTMDCGTVVSVSGFGPANILVEVEFFNAFGVSEGKTSLSQAAAAPDVHAADIGMSLSPFGVNTNANTGSFEGYALVFADDPRIAVGAYLVCSEVSLSLNGFPRSITSLSAYPVGQTRAFFRADLPGMAPVDPAGGERAVPPRDP